MPNVTWIYCRCGHVGEVNMHPGLLHEMLPRARCSKCGKKGAMDARNGWVCDYSEPLRTRGQPAENEANS